ncbi:MAG: restriction endonuclease subunit S [Fusobacteriaceae bacterium]
MEELKEGWKRVKLSEFINFNPRETLKKNTVAKYIEMANLQCFSRAISGYEEKEYKGGTKFKNGDTLLARITPCLQNGKTAYINCLEENEIAFGSTEYIVLREKQYISDRKFIYYLAISTDFRELAIKSMTGTSGRQRVQTDMLINVELNLPPLETQEKIASILSSLDDKIELNNEMNKTLEEMAQTLFKRWFIDFEFPNENGEPYKTSGGKMIDSELGEIPEGWRIGSLEELLEFIIDHRGKTPKKLGGDWSEKGIKAISAKNIKNLELVNLKNMNMVDIEMYNKWMKDKLIDGDILMTSEAPLGELYYLAEKKEYVLSQRIYGLRADRTQILPAVLFYSLQSPVVMSEILNRATGTTVTGIRQTELRKINLIIPPCELQEKIENILHKNLLKKFRLFEEIQSLTEIRNTLLPKLMSGEIEV